MNIFQVVGIRKDLENDLMLCSTLSVALSENVVLIVALLCFL